MKRKVVLLLSIMMCSYAKNTTLKPVDSLYYNEPIGTDFVIRWQYQEFCDHVYDPRIDIWRWPTDEEHGVTFNPQDVKPGDVIFVRKIPQFFKEMHPHIPHPYIILTAGECLDKMEDSYKKFLDKKKVIAWFGVHANQTAMDHSKFHPMPLGILQKPSHYEKKERVHNYFKKLRQTAQKKYLLYMNFAELEKPERQKLRKLLKDEPYVKKGGRQEFQDYLKETAQSYFVLSPIGRAPDCYRTWEALLCGSIPVIRTCQLDPLYEGLPVLVVDRWKDVTEEFLVEKYQEITSKKYDINRLYTTYWTDKINAVRKEYLQGRRQWKRSY